MEILLGIFIPVIVIFLLLRSITIIVQGEVGIVERLGKFKNTISPGMHFKNPLIDKVRLVNMKEFNLDVPPQNVITKDEVTISISTIVHGRVTDPVKVCYSVNDLERSIKYLTQTATRSIIENMNVKEVLSSKDVIMSRLLESVNTTVNEWGAKVNYFEIKDIILPPDYKNVQDKQFENSSVDDVEEILRRAREASKID